MFTQFAQMSKLFSILRNIKIKNLTINLFLLKSTTFILLRQYIQKFSLNHAPSETYFINFQKNLHSCQRQFFNSDVSTQISSYFLKLLLLPSLPRGFIVPLLIIVPPSIIHQAVEGVQEESNRLLTKVRRNESNDREDPLQFHREKNTP